MIVGFFFAFVVSCVTLLFVFVLLFFFITDSHAQMVHLSKEFSFEIILSTIEFNQFLTILQTQFKNVNKSVMDELIETVNNLSSSHVFYSASDKLLFADQGYNKISRIKLLQLPESMPKSLIIVENMKVCLSLMSFINCNENNVNSGNVVNVSEMNMDKPVLCLPNRKQQKAQFNNISKTTNNGDHNREQSSNRLLALMNEINNLLITISVFYNIGFDFYYKYIRVDSELELNIGYHLRQRFCHFFDKYNLISCLCSRNDVRKNTNINGSQHDQSKPSIMISANVNINNNNDAAFNFQELEKYYKENNQNIYKLAQSMHDKMKDKYYGNDDNHQRGFTDYVEYSMVNDMSQIREYHAIIPALDNLDFLSTSDNYNNDDGDDGLITDNEDNIDTMDNKVTDNESDKLNHDVDDDDDDDDEKEQAVLQEIDIDIIENETMIFEIGIDDIVWLLNLNGDFDNNKNENIINYNAKQLKMISNALKMHVYTFLFILTKMFRATNKELNSLLQFSFYRFTKTPQYQSMMSKLDLNSQLN